MALARPLVLAGCGRVAGPDGTDGVALVTVHADAAGDDRDGLPVIVDAGAETLDLGLDGDGRDGATYAVPAGVTLEPGATLTLSTGAGADTAAASVPISDRPIYTRSREND